MRTLVALLAAARLTRFVTTDWLGEWWIGQPAKHWALKHDGEAYAHDGQTQEIKSLNGDVVLLHVYKAPWRTKLVSGLDCAYCVGFWMTALTLVLTALPLPRYLSKTRDLTLEVLAGSYIVGHVSSHLDE